MNTREQRTVLRQIDDYWFGHGSVTTLGVFRILAGSICTINLLLIGLQWNDWFGENGFVPTYVGQIYFSNKVPTGFGPESFVYRIGVLSGISDPRVTIVFYFGLVLASFLTTIGLWTRYTSVLFAIGMVSLQHRNGLILHGGDTVFKLSALYLALSPCGRACSVDRLIRIWKGLEDAVPIEKSLWVQRLICYEVALVYFTTMWLKYWGSHWKDGTATWYTARLPEFYRFPVPSFFAEPPMIYLTTYGTLAVEFALATLVFFRPLRKYVLGAGILMHAYIEYSMNIPLFAFGMCSMYICFYDGEEVTEFFERLGAKIRSRFPKSVVQVPVEAKFQLSEFGRRMFKVLDPLRLIDFAPNAATAGTLPVGVVLRNPAWLPIVGFPNLRKKFIDRAFELAPEKDPAIDSKKGKRR